MSRKLIASLCVIGFFCLAVVSAWAENQMKYNGYSGGMMLHTGYVFGGQSTPQNGGALVATEKMQGMPIGIGGAVRLNFGKYLRVGTEGYSTTLYYGQKGSYATIGWGGLLADCAFTKDSHTFFVGATVGGGAFRNLTLTEAMQQDWEVENNVSYRKYAFMAVTPFVGYEWAITQKIHLVFKLDYLFNVTNPQPDFITGPRLYIGFMFCRGQQNS